MGDMMRGKVIYVATLIGLCLVIVLSVGLPKQHHPRIHHHQVGVRPTKQFGKTLHTHLPIVTLETNHQPIPLVIKEKGEYIKDKDSIPATIALRDQINRSHHLDEKPRVTSKALVAYRGNSSRYFDKKSLKVKFVTSTLEKKEHAFAGMSRDSEWVLHGPFLDRSLVRNYLSYNIAGEVMDYAPNVRYCELIVNKVYQGIYLAVESIEQGKKRIDIEKSDKKANKTPYIVAWDREHKAKQKLDHYLHYSYQAGVSAMDVTYPSQKRLTLGQLDFITKDISRIEKMLYSYDFHQYPRYLDRQSFADYFILNELFRNVDAGKFSTYLYKDLRGKVKLAVWDFNNAFDNQIESKVDEVDFTLTDVPWFSMLMKDKEFVELVIDRYRQLRQGVLATDYLTAYIDNTIAFLGPAIQRNNAKWGYVYQLNHPDSKNYLLPLERNMTSYEESVEQLKEFIRRRGRWLDKHIETLYQYSAPSKNANTILE
ncbi:CotH kinase family protein [Streptococcus dysgalactiae]|uniref:CotH kinase family protein n=1 Tax=Streptococcus dysgalactiae TaxID=1334 RepID=UPI001C4C8316|nr:CotH kinase family protein [Streptococcus dysgalactiae]